MGLAAAGTVAIAVLIAMTLLPALLGFAGDRIARLNRVLGFRAAPPRRPRREKMSIRWATLRHPPAGTGPARRAGRCCSRVAIPALHMKLGPAGRRLQPDVDHRAQGVRPPHRGLRPRLQRRR